MRQDHEGREKGGAEERDHDPPVKLPVRRAVDLRGLQDLVVDPAQTREEHRHHEARGLPDGGDDDGVDRHVAILDPGEGKGVPAPEMHDPLEPDAGIEEPFPRRAGDDERQRHRVEVDRPQGALAPDLLVEEDRQHQADQGADHDVERGEDRDVDERGLPGRQGEELLVVLEAHPVILGQHLRAGERKDHGEEDEAVNEEQRHGEGWREHKLRQPVLQTCAEIGLGCGHGSLLAAVVGSKSLRELRHSPSKECGVWGAVGAAPLLSLTARRRRLRPARQRRPCHRRIRR